MTEPIIETLSKDTDRQYIQDLISSLATDQVLWITFNDKAVIAVANNYVIPEGYSVRFATAKEIYKEKHKPKYRLNFDYFEGYPYMACFVGAILGLTVGMLYEHFLYGTVDGASGILLRTTGIGTILCAIGATVYNIKECIVRRR
jgi:hypothetical protein